MRKGRLLLPLLAMFLIVACSKGIEGTYTNESASAAGIEETFTFDGDGKVIVDNHEMDYTIDGDKIKIKSPDGTIVFMRQKDGSLVGPSDIKLIKQKP